MTIRTSWVVGGVIAAAAIIGGIFFYQANFSQGIAVEIIKPESILIGVPFNLPVNISNKSGNVLESVRLNLNLPEGLAFVGSPASKNIDFKEISNLPSGASNQQIFRLIATNGKDSFKRVSASVNYLSGTLSSRFESQVEADLAIGDYAIVLDVATPEKVFNGEILEAEVSFKNNSGIDFNDLRLKIDYPLTFTLAKTTLAPDIGNNIWILGGLRAGSDMKFKIIGSIIGPEEAFFDLKAVIEATVQGQSYPVSENTATISIAASPISLKINLNNDNELIAGLSSDLRYVLNYTNNTDVGLRDVIIKTQLAGVMYDFSTISTGGAFRSSDNTIVWTAANVPALANLSPGQSGSVDFSIRTKNQYPIKRLSDKNFILKTSATIESPTVPHFVAANKTVSFAVLENKVRGQATIDAKAYFRDAASGILNKGPMPPRVNQATQFTIHWQITNYSTDLKDVSVKASLGGNVKFTGVVKGNGPTSPVFNDRTQEIVWEIPKVLATTGLTGAPMEAIFQVEATPSSIDLGRNMLLIQDTGLKAVDEFTGIDISNKDNAITTQLPDDPTVGGQGMVTQ